MKNDLHNFARYGNRLSTESSRFLQFVLVIDTFTTKWKCVLQDRHVASLLKVRVGQPPPQKKSWQAKKIKKDKKNFKKFRKKKFVGEGVRSISCNSNFAVEFLLFTSIYYNNMLPKKLGEGATPYAWYFIFLSVNLNLLRKKWDPLPSADVTCLREDHESHC